MHVIVSVKSFASWLDSKVLNLFPFLPFPPVNYLFSGEEQQGVLTYHFTQTLEVYSPQISKEEEFMKTKKYIP